jgi:Uma2 family endonuclease
MLMEAHLKQRLLTVQEYHRMSETGILTESDRVELLNGRIIYMSPIGSKHAACVEKIGELLKQFLAGKAMVRAQNPVILDEHSEPEPDIAIVKRKDNYYADRHPVAEETFLVIEVADTSLEKDRLAKQPLYAAAQIPEYWIVNLEKNEVEVYRSPIDEQYRSRHIFLPGDEIALSEFGVSVQVDGLLV